MSLSIFANFLIYNFYTFFIWSMSTRLRISFDSEDSTPLQKEFVLQCLLFTREFSRVSPVEVPSTCQHFTLQGVFSGRIAILQSLAESSSSLSAKNSSGYMRFNWLPLTFLSLSSRPSARTIVFCWRCWWASAGVRTERRQHPSHSDASWSVTLYAICSQHSRDLYECLQSCRSHISFWLQKTVWIGVIHPLFIRESYLEEGCGETLIQV